MRPPALFPSLIYTYAEKNGRSIFLGYPVRGFTEITCDPGRVYAPFPKMRADSGPTDVVDLDLRLLLEAEKRVELPRGVLDLLVDAVEGRALHLVDDQIVLLAELLDVVFRLQLEDLREVAVDQVESSLL